MGGLRLVACRGMGGSGADGGGGAAPASSKWHCLPSCQWMQLRPAFFEAYIAVSARLSNATPSSPGSHWATPMLAVRESRCAVQST